MGPVSLKNRRLFYFNSDVGTTARFKDPINGFWLELFAPKESEKDAKVTNIAVTNALSMKKESPLFAIDFNHLKGRIRSISASAIHTTNSYSLWMNEIDIRAQVKIDASKEVSASAVGATQNPNALLAKTATDLVIKIEKALKQKVRMEEINIMLSKKKCGSV